MRYYPALYRIRRQPVPAASETLLLPGGGLALDIGAVLHQLEMRELLKNTGTRGRL